jgi:hypothetical protein
MSNVRSQGDFEVAMAEDHSYKSLEYFSQLMSEQTTERRDCSLTHTRMQNIMPDIDTIIANAEPWTDEDFLRSEALY